MCKAGKSKGAKIAGFSANVLARWNINNLNNDNGLITAWQNVPSEVAHSDLDGTWDNIPSRFSTIQRGQPGLEWEFKRSKMGG